ncbi:MAG: PEGA domain-containing protein [Candidatus Riflebacteria bacterium]|nr:PEGA domain-containing protein [Candidatus Riflebacteria bacterium]
MIRSLELYPGPKADFREACILLRSDNFAGDRVLLLYAQVVVTAEALLGDRIRFLVGTEEDPAQFYTSPGMPVSSADPFLRRLTKNRGFFSVMVRGTADRDSASLSRRGYIDTSGGHAQGLRLLKAGQPQRAAIAFSQALEKNPGLHNLHYLLGRCYQIVGDTHAAVDSYTAEMKASRHPQAPYAIGKILEERGDRETARLYYQEALRRDGLNLSALVSLTLGHLFAGEFEEFWEMLGRAYQIAGEDQAVGEILRRAAGVFKIESDEVLARINRKPISKEILEEILLNKLLFENGAFLLAQEAFERFIGGLRDRDLKQAVAALYSEMVKNAIENVSPWEASRVVPKLHYSLEGLKTPGSRELVLNYGTVLETAFRDLRWFIDPLWANYLVEDLEELQAECPDMEELGVFLMRVYGNLLEDQVHLGRPDGIQKAQERMEHLLEANPGNQKLPYTLLTCLSYLTELAAGKQEATVAPEFLERALELARQYQDSPRIRDHTGTMLETFVERLTRRRQWDLLEQALSSVAASAFAASWKESLLERLQCKMLAALPEDAPDVEWLRRLRTRDNVASPTSLFDPVLRGIRNLVGVPVPGAILVVRSDPDGKEIFINGRGAGITPRRFEDFPAGEYTVGVGNVYRRVELKDGNPVRMRFHMSDGQVEIEESFEYSQPLAELKLAGKLEKLDGGVHPQHGGMLEVSFEDGVKVVRVRRDVTPIRELSFQEELLNVLGEEGPCPLVVDVSGVHWIGSLGIALLAKLFQMNGRRNMVVVRGERPDFRVDGKVCQEVKTIFDFLLKYVPAAPSLDEAVALARQGGMVH